MSIEKAFDPEVKAARYLMRDTQSAYKAAIRARNELVVKKHETEGWDVYILMAQFQMKRDAVEKVLSEAKPIRKVATKPITSSSQSSASIEARGRIK